MTSGRRCRGGRRGGKRAMAKRCYYEVLEVERTANDGELKAAFRKLAMKWHPGPQSRRQGLRAPLQGNQRGLRGPEGRATSAPPMTASAMPPSSRAAAAAARLRRRFRLGLLRYLRRHLRHGAARAAAATAASAAPTCATTWRSRSRRPIAGKTAQVRLPTSVTCESCSGTGAKAGTKPKTCPTLQRRRPHPPRAGLLHAGAHLPGLPGPRPGDRRSVPVLLGLRPRDARAHAVGQHSARRRGRHPHPARRRGRGRRARRPGRRPLHFPLARRASRSSSATAPTCIAACRSRW